MGRWSSSGKPPRKVKEVPGEMPVVIEPQLATAAQRPPSRGDWLYEIKFDGYRMLTRIEDTDIRFITRNGHDWTDRLSRLTKAVVAIPAQNAWLDGEAVVLDEAGRPDFNLLQNAFDRRSTADVVMFYFDLLWLDGDDLRSQPLRARRDLLRELLAKIDEPAIRFSDDFAQDPQSLLASACEMRLEGIIGKRADAPYRSGRSTDWIKLKCNMRQETVICGFTRPKGARSGVQWLLLGVYEADGTLRYVGKVTPHLRSSASTAFTRKAMSLAVPAPPFSHPPQLESDRDYYWLRPALVCEVEFLEWTPGGEMRLPAFRALRDDKPAREVTVEPLLRNGSDGGEASTPAAGDNATVRGIKISHPRRVMDASTGFTKLDVARYYEAIAEWALPHLNNRPVSLLRAPDGIEGQQFFQKYAEQSKMPGVEQLPRQLNPGHPPLLVANTAQALVGLAQMGVVELHSWNAVAPDLDHPDRVVFDLDPDPALPWGVMTEAAMLLKVVLDELGLRSFPKTSGGKGLHVVVPLTRKQGWEEVKAFSRAVAQHMAHVIPGRFSAISGPRNRVGKIFIDYLRNSKGASTVAAFSVRARPGLAVSMPVAWDEVTTLRGADQWNIKTAPARLQALHDDVWPGYAKVRQGVTVAMQRAVGAAR